MNASLHGIPRLSCAAILTLATAGAAPAAVIVANFDGGAGSSQVDQYPGIAGDGWTNAWTPTTDVSVSVLSGNQLNGGGNYLSVTNAIAATRGVSRSYDNFGDIDRTQVQVIKFDWRFDGNINDVSTTGDRLYIADGSLGGRGESENTTFNVRVHGAAQGTANALEWTVYNGAQDAATSFDNSRWVNTGMSLQPDVVYSFTITVDPQNRTYSVSIDNGTTAVNVNDMGFRTNQFTTFGTLHFMSNKGAGAKNLTYGFDSVSIAVPEPSSLALASIFMLANVRRSRHR